MNVRHLSAGSEQPLQEYHRTAVHPVPTHLAAPVLVSNVSQVSAGRKNNISVPGVETRPAAPVLVSLCCRCLQAVGFTGPAHSSASSLGIPVPSFLVY
jgi:hypothetical protein